MFSNNQNCDSGPHFRSLLKTHRFNLAFHHNPLPNFNVVCYVNVFFFLLESIFEYSKNCHISLVFYYYNFYTMEYNVFLQNVFLRYNITRIKS